MRFAFKRLLLINADLVIDADAAEFLYASDQTGVIVGDYDDSRMALGAARPSRTYNFRNGNFLPCGSRIDRAMNASS